MIALLSLAAHAEPLQSGALLGPWCLPGEPACTFDLREDGAWEESTDQIVPWRLEGDRLLLDPAGPTEQGWQILEAAGGWIVAEQDETGAVFWFLRTPSVLPAVLADFAPIRWSGRARAGGLARWRLTDDSPWQDAGQPAFPEELVVVEERPDALRVLAEGAGLRAAVWVERTGFSEHIVSEVALSAGVTALPGAPVERAAPEGKLRVSIAEGGMTVFGAVSASELGQVYTPTEPDRSFQAILTSPTIHDADGAVIATLSLAEWGWWVAEADPTADGQVRIVVRTDHLRVEGFVPRESITPAEGGLLGSLHSRGHASGTHSVDLHLSTGTPLEVAGQIVGVTTAVTTLQAAPVQHPPDISATTWLPWGMATVLVRCPGLESTDQGWECDPGGP